MNDNQTYNKISDMRLYGMMNLSQRFNESPQLIPESASEYFSSMVDAEYHDRKHRKQLRMMKNAKLKYSNACLEDFDFSIDRGVTRQMIGWISGLSWLDKHQNLIITGATGSGKSHTACGTGNSAIRQGYSVLYKRVPRLCEELETAHGDGSLPSLRAKIQKFNLLILDEWAVSPLTPRARLDILEIIEDRAGSGSLVVTSQMPIEQWHAYIGEPTIADAIMDRLIHRSHKIELRGESMRKLKESV
jgi:DNA replication protein DnaC